MKAYRIDFERVGRNKAVTPLRCAVAGEADLCYQIRQHVRPHLRSRDFDVMVDTETGKGWLAAGMHNAGEFTITETAREAC